MRTTKKLIAILLCLAMLPCSLLTVFAEGEETQTDAVDDGTVLYYQQFGMKSDGTQITPTYVETGMSAGTTGNRSWASDGRWKIIGNSNYSATHSNIKFPADLVTENDTYTIELEFAFSLFTYGNSTLTIVDGNNNRITFNPRQKHKDGISISTAINNSTGETIDFSKATNAEKSIAWGNIGSTSTEDGNIVRLIVEIKDGKLYAAEILDNEYTFNLQLDDVTFNGTALALGSYASGILYSSLRVVKGVDYTEYKGQYATTSYNGYEDPMINNVGLQPAINNNSVRLVGEIRGTEFDAAGFEMQIRYTDSKGNTHVSSEQLSPEAIHTAYKSIKAGNGTAKPSSLNYYLIVLEISEIPTDITDVVITFRPYAKSGDITHYGATYVYNHAAKAITVAE